MAFDWSALKQSLMQQQGLNNLAMSGFTPEQTISWDPAKGQWVKQLAPQFGGPPIQIPPTQPAQPPTPPTGVLRAAPSPQTGTPAAAAQPQPVTKPPLLAPPPPQPSVPQQNWLATRSAPQPYATTYQRQRRPRWLRSRGTFGQGFFGQRP